MFYTFRGVIFSAPPPPDILYYVWLTCYDGGEHSFDAGLPYLQTSVEVKIQLRFENNLHTWSGSKIHYTLDSALISVVCCFVGLCSVLPLVVRRYIARIMGKKHF